MFNSRKNINIIVGLLAVLHLLFSNSKAIAIDNVTQSRVLFSITVLKNLPVENYDQSQKNKNSYLIKTPRSRRKFALNDTNNSLVSFDKAINFHFDSSIIVVDFNNHQIQSSVSLSLLRGPPIA